MKIYYATTTAGWSAQEVQMVRSGHAVTGIIIPRINGDFDDSMPDTDVERVFDTYALACSWAADVTSHSPVAIGKIAVLRGSIVGWLTTLGQGAGLPDPMPVEWIEIIDATGLAS